MIVALRVLVGLALLYNAWIIFRVVNDWAGLLAGITSIVLLPISVMVMPVLMFFIPSVKAGPLSLWPGLLVIFLSYKIVEKKGGTLLLLK